MFYLQLRKNVFEKLKDDFDGNIASSSDAEDEMIP